MKTTIKYFYDEDIYDVEVKKNRAELTALFFLC